ncbi:MAG: hypothetical protein NTZ05_20075, partial [Chloroflexi bacterium]|nr:hypothetical protein [Chloroflexota bacterium]
EDQTQRAASLQWSLLLRRRSHCVSGRPDAACCVSTMEPAFAPPLALCEAKTRRSVLRLYNGACFCAAALSANME